MHNSLFSFFIIILLQPCNIYLGNTMKYFIDWLLSLLEDKYKREDEYNSDIWGI